MDEKGNEIPLTSTWLNSRERFDKNARNPLILREFIQYIDVLGKDSFTIADLGCGTGSNVLYLSEQINSNTIWHLVERESDLLNEAKKRLKTKFNSSWKEENNVCYAAFQGKQMAFHFHNETIDIFLNKPIDLNAVTASALFDLFTKKEFSELHEILSKRELILYSVLNYTGMNFIPTEKSDTSFISLFEAHMSRELAKGKPMGIHTISNIKTIINSDSVSSISIGDSDWKIDPSEKKFLQMNFLFYNDGITNTLRINNKSTNHFQIWMYEKHKLIDQ